MDIQALVLLFDLLLRGLLTADTIAKDVPVVHFHKLITSNPNFTMQWDPVETKDPNNPILGFKMKVWEAPCVNGTVYEDEWTEEVRTFRKKLDPGDIPDEKPLYEYIIPPDKLQYTVPKILLGVWHHVRILAFTKTAEGPLSDPYQFLIGADKENSTCNEFHQRVTSTTSPNT